MHKSLLSFTLIQQEAPSFSASVAVHHSHIVEGKLMTPKVHSPGVSRQVNPDKGKLFKKNVSVLYLFTIYKVTVGRN